MERILVNPTALKDARAIGYNHGVIADGAFYMAGQVAMDADSEIVGDDIGTQARKVYENLGTLLGAVGKGFADVVKVTTHIVDPDEHYADGYKPVYRAHFDEPYPCHTVLGVAALADEAYLVEVEVEVPLTSADVAAVRDRADGEEIRVVG